MGDVEVGVTRGFADDGEAGSSSDLLQILREQEHGTKQQDKRHGEVA